MDENEQKCTKIGENEKNKQERTIKNMDKKKHDWTIMSKNLQK